MKGIILIILISVLASEAQLPNVNIIIFGKSFEDRVTFKYGSFRASTLRSIGPNYFDFAKKTTIYISGWLQTINVQSSVDLINAYIDHKNDFNVLVIDWSFYAVNKAPTTVASRLMGVSISGIIMIREAINAGLNVKDLHIIGFSFGAHIAGQIARGFQNPKIPRVTALDPATENGLGLVYRMSGLKIINSDVATFVDIIHTDVVLFGIAKPLGHVDFYINGNGALPGCENSIAKRACNHVNAVKLYAESVRRIPSRPFIASTCNAIGGPTPSDCKASMGFYADVTTTNRNSNVRVIYNLDRIEVATLSTSFASPMETTFNQVGTSFSEQVGAGRSDPDFDEENSSPQYPLIEIEIRPRKSFYVRILLL